jgi:small subunit ribosomal protein S16
LAVKLRLARKGKKKQPFYRIVAADSRSRRDGKYIEKIGFYNPITNPAEIVIDEEKAFYWLKNGAIPTETVANLFSKKGIMLKWYHIKQGHDEVKVEEEYKKWELLQLERQKREEALAAQAKRKQEDKVTEEEPAPEAAETEAAPEAKADSAPEIGPGVEAKPVEQETIEPQSQEEAVESQPEEETSEPQAPNIQTIEEAKPDIQPADETDEIKK